MKSIVEKTSTPMDSLKRNIMRPTRCKAMRLFIVVSPKTLNKLRPEISGFMSLSVIAIVNLLVPNLSSRLSTVMKKE